MDVQRWLSGGVAAIDDWQAAFGPFERHPSLRVSDERFAGVFSEFTERLRENYPFFHPSYAGQMLKPPHPAAVVGYLTAMLVNPNNHALDGGPATARMEKEAVAQLAGMFGLATHLGHLTTSGTIANLEALYVARELHPGRGVAYSAEAHYTHGRMCGVLGVEGTPVATDDAGRMDLGALDRVLAGGRVGTVVATAGTTGLGAIDPVHEVLAIARSHGSASTSTLPTAAFSSCWRAWRTGPGLTRRRGGPSPGATPWSSTRTSTACSPTAAGRCCSATPTWGVSTCTTPPTPTSPPATCISARSAWNAHGPGRPPPRCGSRSGSCRPRRTASAGCWRPDAARRWTGPS